MEEYIVFDLETTGIAPSKDKILEIGALHIRDARPVRKFATLVNPGVVVPERITELTGITDKMAKTGMEYKEAVQKLIDFIGDLPILGHNVRFDFSFLKAAATNQNLAFSATAVDTLRISRALLPELPHHNLSFLCDFYRIDPGNSHRALDDANATWNLYESMKRQFPDADPGLMGPVTITYKAKKQSPITEAQKRYLNDLCKYHKIQLTMQIDSLTKSEASRIIDRIILEKGRILR